jgi:hypothetical protein
MVAEAVVQPSAISVAESSPLVQQAVAALHIAQTVKSSTLVEERSVWQPGSWLISRLWEALADAGAGHEALTVAALTHSRQPLAPLHALHRLAQQVHVRPLLAHLVNAELERLEPTLFRPVFAAEEAHLAERLLLVGATAGRVGNLPLACACLERLDQTSAKPWDRVFARPELRALLVESVAHIGLHPLTKALVDNAVRRYDDAGAHFLHDLAAQVADLGESAPRRSKRLLLRCVETFSYATLVSLHSRRLAAITLARTGQVDALLGQLAFIANVQDARRETGYSVYKDDPLLLRQVKRPAANADVDFQAYTLQQAIAVMPLRQMSRENRIALADHLAGLGLRSDGWTAAGVAATLIDLGALKYALEVVSKINPQDPTRAEGMLALVRGLLAVDETQLAAEQAQRALVWARARPDRNPERAITWGLAEIYLEHGQPQQALRWLAQWREPVGWRYRLKTLWRRQLDDDALRLRGLRLRGLLQQQSQTGSSASPLTGSPPVEPLIAELRTWAPRLLEGEALVNFYIDGLLRPLLAAGQQRAAWDLLPELVKALTASSGNKHASQVLEVASLLAQPYRLAALPAQPATNGDVELAAPALTVTDTPLRAVLERFLTSLWQADSRRGPWPIVHSLEGSIPLILALDGPATLVAIARAASERSRLWSMPSVVPS